MTQGQVELCKMIIIANNTFHFIFSSGNGKFGIIQTSIQQPIHLSIFQLWCYRQGTLWLLFLLPGNLRAFQMTIVLSTLQEASHTSWGDHATSITSTNVTHTHTHSFRDVSLVKGSHCSFCRLELLWSVSVYDSVLVLLIWSNTFSVYVLPPVWFLRIVTHLHCSTLASLLLDPNTVLGPMNLQRKHTRGQSQTNNHQLWLLNTQTAQTSNISIKFRTHSVVENNQEVGLKM